MTFLFWAAVVPAVIWGVLWAVGEVFDWLTAPDRFEDVDELARRNR